MLHIALALVRHEKNAVKLVGFRTDSLALIRAADAFVLPSACEGFGLVLIEAMSV